MQPVEHGVSIVHSEQRRQRLARDFESLLALKRLSTILDFECVGDPPDRYSIVFNGRGLVSPTLPPRPVTVDRHLVEMRLPNSYSTTPPDIRWVTPLFHPNISRSGLIDWDDIGLSWEPDLGLDVISERLWDVARLAFLDLDPIRNQSAQNQSARRWFIRQQSVSLPVDPRPLRDCTLHRGIPILFIGEETAETSLLWGSAAPSPRRKMGALPSSEVLYIE